MYPNGTMNNRSWNHGDGIHPLMNGTDKQFFKQLQHSSSSHADAETQVAPGQNNHIHLLEAREDLYQHTAVSLYPGSPKTNEFRFRRTLTICGQD